MSDTPITPREPDLVDLLVDYVVRLEPTLQPRRGTIEQEMRAEFGGDRWYIQARAETQRQRRVREILALFNGRNASEVARTLRISRATVYRVIKQPGLPPAQPASPAQPETPRRAAPRQARPPADTRLSQPLPTAETPPQVG